MNVLKHCCIPEPVQKVFYRNLGNVSRATGIISKRWAVGETITWHSPQHPDLPKIREAFETWSEHANLNFQEIPTRNSAKIRVGWDYTLGSWSYIGTDAMSIPAPDTTLNIGWSLTGNDPTALHEVGHGLSLGHEHQSPNRTLVFDKAKVYADYNSAGWTQQEVDLNVLNTLSTTDATPYDVKSIMHYAMPAAHITSPQPYASQGTPNNYVLSELDKVWASNAYPGNLQVSQLPPLELREFDSNPGEVFYYDLDIPLPGLYSVALIGQGSRKAVILDDNGQFIAGGQNLNSANSITLIEFNSLGNGNRIEVTDFDGAPGALVYWKGGIE